MWPAALCSLYSCFFGPRWETNSCKKCWRCLSEGVPIDWWTPRNPHEAVEERFQMYPGTNSRSTNGQNHDWGGLVLTWKGLLAVAMAEVSEGNKKNHFSCEEEIAYVTGDRKERVAQVLPPHERGRGRDG